MTRFSLATWLLFLSLAWATRTLAQPGPSDDERAQTHFHAGTSYFDDGRFAESAAEFDEAYRLSQRAMLLANASLAYERAGNLGLAIERLEAYFAATAEGERIGGYMTSPDRLEGLRARYAAQQASATEPDVEGPDSDDRDGEDGLDEGTARLEDESGRRGLLHAGIGVAGVGVAMGVGALVLGLRAHALARDLRGACGPNGDQCPPDRADDIARGPRLSRAAGALGVGAGVSVALGATLALLSSRRHADDARRAEGDGDEASPSEARTAPRTSAAFDVSRHGAHLSLTGSF